MSGRIFQNVVLQLKENTDRTVGVIDGEGVVIACSELSMIGQRWGEYVAAVNGAAGSMVCFDGKTFKALSGWGNQFDYAAFAFGDNEISKTICSMATVALNAAKSYYEEKHDRGSFVKDIISDNIMLGDIYMRAKELRVATYVSRGVFAIRSLQKGESVPTETIQNMFPDRQNDFVLSVGGSDSPAAGGRRLQGAEQDRRPDRGGVAGRRREHGGCRHRHHCHASAGPCQELQGGADRH